MWIDDDILERCAEPLALACFVPQVPVVVLGSSNQPDVEADPGRCAADGVPILKRYGGGGTVVLHGGCAVVSLGTWVKRPYENKHYFDLLNRAVIAALEMPSLSQRGLSDIVAGDRKVAGTSLFRSRNYLLYQASILVDPEVALIARYLRHPSREPDYRQGRDHASFIAGLAALVPGLTSEACVALLNAALPTAITDLLADELIAPVPTQFEALLARAARGRAAQP